MSSPSLFDAQCLRVLRGGQPVLDALDLRLGPAERLFVLGPCGAGKSTLLQTLLGFVPLAAGSLRLLGQPCRTEAQFAPMRGPVGLLFQDPDDQLFGPTVLEDAAFGPLNQGLDRTEARARAWAALRQVGVDTLAERPVQALSGGQKRLAALAGVLAMRPAVLLLDEPTAALDADSAGHVTQVLADSGLPMVVATHDQALVTRLATRCQTLGPPLPAKTPLRSP